jgi:RNA polymerase sigma-70 factor (ECF subfamily)
LNFKTRIKSENQFRKIVTAHQERVYATCYRFLRSREDAQDVTQEVFMQVYKSMEDFRGEAKISTWIYRIAVTRSLDLIRKQNRKRHLGSVTGMFRIGSGEDEIDVPGGPTPEGEFMASEDSRVLAWAVSRLPENQRVAIVLCNYENYSNKEVAEIMQISVSAVEGLLHRARKNLRKRLTQYYSNRGH